jgi:selenocysteine-specific elongation factor
MNTGHFIVATAGHVDHGKSALVKALTGTDPDRLPEEKARQITIDLGFAELNLVAPNGDKFHLGIVDVPGHEDFVRNMIAGVGCIDLALLVVAADDGWMPQTEEHLQILTYLGVQHAVVALTKSDLGSIDLARKQIRSKLRDTAFTRSRIVATSTRTGQGIEDLKSALASQLAAMQPQRDIAKPRLFVDRAFTLHGIGTVVTGTLTGGRLRRGDQVVVQPQSFPARIRSIQSHGSEVETAHPGMRTAINLPELGIGDGPGQIKRGDAITTPDLGEASAVLIALLEKSARLDAESPAARPLRNGASIYVHHGTSRVEAKIAFLENNSLERGKKALAQIRLASPIFAFVGDHLVVRDPSQQHTIAGGIVLEPDADTETFRAARKRSALAERALTPHDADLCARTEIALRGFADSQTLLRKSHFSADELSEALRRLERNGKIVLHQGIVANGELWQGLRAQAAACIDEAHKKNPERAGVELAELRAMLPLQEPGVFDALVADLCAAGFSRKGSVIARAAHRQALPVALQPIAQKIREALAQKPFDPPARRELEWNSPARQVVRFLVETGEVIEISREVVLLRENFERMKSQIEEFISREGPATVSQLRQALGSSRRVMVPLLERLDCEGMTRRAGDQRRLAEK